MRKRKKCTYEIIMVTYSGEKIRCYDFGFITDVQKKAKALNKTKTYKCCRYKAVKY